MDITFKGGVFCEHDERIWCIPFDSERVLTIDPEMKTTSHMFEGQLPERGKGKWAGAVVGIDGCIYWCGVCVKIFSSPLSFFHPLHVYAFSLTAIMRSWKTSVPYNASCVLKLDPLKRTASAIGNFPGSGKWSGGVLAPDG
jgi:hypothetical protein